MFYFCLSDKEFLAGMQRLVDKADNASPVLKAIGEDLKESTKKRFGTATAPDGSKWQDNSKTTQAIKGRNQPLIGENHILRDTIDYQLYGDTLLIGSPMEYAIMQNFGGQKQDYPHLWGDIPARQFLGISTEYETNILDTIADYLSS